MLKNIKSINHRIINKLPNAVINFKSNLFLTIFNLSFFFSPLSSLNGEELRTLSMLYELTCHMVHLNTHFVSQFCDAVAILGAYKLLVNFLCHVSDENNTTIRLVNNVLATLACALRELPENAEIIERIIFDKDVDLAKLFRHNDPLLK